MNESPTLERKSDWSLLLCAAAAALIVYLPFALFGSADFGMIIFVLLAVIISLTLLVFVALNKGKRRLSIASMLVVYSMFSAIIVMNNSVVRDIARWSVRSKSYKAAVLGKADSKRGSELQHVEWDGWGWAGAYTDAYIVFDPNDSLAAAARNLPAGKLNGIPCEVYRIHRLEKHWYAATFYTDDVWDQCTNRTVP